MFCANCGAPSATGARFCERCGRPLTAATPSPAGPPPTMQPPPPGAMWPPAAPTVAQPQGRKRAWIVAAVALVVMAAGAVTWFVTRPDSPHDIVESLEQVYVEGVQRHDVALLREYFADPELVEGAVDYYPEGTRVTVESIDIVSATDRKIVARVVTTGPAMAPDASPGDVETITGELVYELVDTGDGEDWRFVTGTVE